MRVLLIEDEERLAQNVAEAMRECSFAVDLAANGKDGLHLAEQAIFDVVILDLMLPLKSGQDVLRDLRRRRVRTPVLILTAQQGKSSVIELLNQGADDYLSKPFDLGELIARVKALIRRSRGNPSPVLKSADLEIDTINQTVTRNGRVINLSPTQYRILEYMAHRPRAVVSQRELLEHLYDFTWNHHSNVIEMHISNLRRKLTSGDSTSLIETLRTRGYRLHHGSERSADLGQC